MGRLLADLGSSLGMLTISLGTRSGLWSALAGAGPLTVEQVAARTTVDRALVREWLRAQAASGYLGYDPGEDAYTLPESAAAVFVGGPGAAMVEACLSMLVSMAEGFDDFSAAFAAGKGFGWHQRSAEHWHGTDALTQVALPGELIARGHRAAPRCPGGVELRAVRHWTSDAATAPRPDPSPSSIPRRRCSAPTTTTPRSCGRERAPPVAAIKNVRFEVAPAAGLPARDGGYHLITFFDSLHDVGDPRAALARAREVLAPGGAVLLVEPLGADDVADNLNPLGRMFYSISVLACTPNAVSQRTATSSEPLGAQAGEATLRALATEAGFRTVRRLDLPAPMNLVLELRP